jgi:hypothetical protein
VSASLKRKSVIFFLICIVVFTACVSIVLTLDDPPMSASVKLIRFTHGTPNGRCGLFEIRNTSKKSIRPSSCYAPQGAIQIESIELKAGETKVVTIPLADPNTLAVVFKFRRRSMKSDRFSGRISRLLYRFNIYSSRLDPESEINQFQVVSDLKQPK